MSISNQNVDPIQFFHGKSVDRPADWSIFSLEPIRIEFLSFEQTRFYKRILFGKIGQSWETTVLQP
ncbi:hypothetical protein OIU83_01855 [Flavobacterium sp. LS1R49]|uniref:Uncharacterized protein n=1 Tax=Flavobacterium shii TaxID=2987687 RepID=A0A9X3BX01_9FLAO|nr:hypothetical protein [Flavobacterium shii]MCV9926380.1 hypothetical protein [Flavobacterium shii]